MSIQRLPSGNYRVQKQIDGRRHSATFDHKPTKKEVAEWERKLHTARHAQTFADAFDVYIDSKSNVLSPSTIRGYRKDCRMLSSEFTGLALDDVTQLAIQREINMLAETHAPKTVRNIHGLISAVIRQFKPDMIINTTLPQKARIEPYVPSDDDVRRILDYMQDDDYYVPVALGFFGLRKSEMMALELSDVHDDYVMVSKAMVKDDSNQWIVKPVPKTTTSYRRAYIPPELANRIRRQGFVWNGSETTLNRRLRVVQTKLGIPHFSYHKARHYFASRLATLTDEATALQMGGWSTDAVYKSTYRHSLESERHKADVARKMGDIFLR